MSTSRTTNYNHAEDQHLAQCWLDITQDPIVGRNQSKAVFWQRVLDKYNAGKPSSKEARNSRSVQCRMRILLKDCRKFKGCVRQVELLHLSGANEQIVLQHAHQAFVDHTGCKDGFKFDHVWPILKEYLHDETQVQGGNFSDSEENMMESPTSFNPSLPPFTVNLSDDNTSGGSSAAGRPEGIKKSKLKRKQGEDMSKYLHLVKEGNDKLLGFLENAEGKKDRGFDIQQRKNDIRQQVRDDNILMINPNSIEDPERREAIMLEQKVIIEKRKQAHMSTSSNNMFDLFGNFPDVGGSGTGFPSF